MDTVKVTIEFGEEIWEAGAYKGFRTKDAVTYRAKAATTPIGMEHVAEALEGAKRRAKEEVLARLA